MDMSEKTIEYESWFVNQYLHPIQIPNKDALYGNIAELGRSIGFFLSRKYFFFSELLRETERLLANSVSLFEKGYFDAAFYLLRESIEVSTTFVYLYDLLEEKRICEYEAWKSENARFAMQGDMLKELQESGLRFPDFKEKMPAFFEKQRATYKSLNKHIHKQGFSRLYISRWRNPGKNQYGDEFRLLNEFLFLLKEVIGIAAVSRLMIDPMPILLGEEEIAYRLADVLEEPFSPPFVKKYIGDGILSQYKTTLIYIDFKKDIMAKEKLSEEVYTFVKWNIFERKDIPIILKQAHLLSFHHWVVLEFAARYEELIKIHLYDGLLSFIMENSKGEEGLYSFSSEDFKKMREGQVKVNIPYKGGFMSIVNVNGCDFFLEYEHKFEDMRLKDVYNFSKYLNDKIKEHGDLVWR